jgi:hypothetical protein
VGWADEPKNPNETPEQHWLKMENPAMVRDVVRHLKGGGDPAPAYRMLVNMADAEDVYDKLFVTVAFPRVAPVDAQDALEALEANGLTVTGVTPKRVRDLLVRGYEAMKAGNVVDCMNAQRRLMELLGIRPLDPDEHARLIRDTIGDVEKRRGQKG